jgi:hypothetical protein
MAKTVKIWNGTDWVDLGVKAALPPDYVDTTALNAALVSYKQEINVSISANTNLVAGRRYFVDTTAARTLTLPASPAVGNEIQVFDASGLAGTNNITINSNSGKINGAVQDLILDANGAVAILTYTGSTYGWRF